MDALGGADGVGVVTLVERAHLVGPHSGRVDHHLGPHRQVARLAAVVRSHDGPVDGPVSSRREADDRRVVGDGGAVLEGCRAQNGQGQPGVVRPRVEIEEAGDEVVGRQRREMGERLVPADFPVPFSDAPAAGDVVHPKGRRIGPGHRLGHDAVAAEERDQEREGRDQVRGVVQEALALGQVLVDQPELTLLEVADTAVDHLGGFRRRARCEVPFFDQRRPQTPARCIERDARAGDPTTDDQHVELLVGEAAQRVVAMKRVHRSSLPHPPEGSPWGFSAAVGKTAAVEHHRVRAHASCGGGAGAPPRCRARWWGQSAPVTTESGGEHRRHRLHDGVAPTLLSCL